MVDAPTVESQLEKMAPLAKVVSTDADPIRGGWPGRQTLVDPVKVQVVTEDAAAAIGELLDVGQIGHLGCVVL
jgi:hypothetical protein